MVLFLILQPQDGSPNQIIFSKITIVIGRPLPALAIPMLCGFILALLEKLVLFPQPCLMVRGVWGKRLGVF